MLIQYIRYRIRSEERHEFVEAFCVLVRQLDTLPACIAYDLKECLDDPTLFILRVEWNPEMGRYAFRAPAFLPGQVRDGTPFPEEVLENHYYRPTGINKRK